MALQKIGSQHGAEAMRQRLIKLDAGSAYNMVLGEPGKKYAESPSLAVEGTMRKLIEGHNDYVAFKELMDRRPF